MKKILNFDFLKTKEQIKKEKLYFKKFHNNNK